MIHLTPKPSPQNFKILWDSLWPPSSLWLNPFIKQYGAFLKRKKNATSNQNIGSLKTGVEEEKNKIFEQLQQELEYTLLKPDCHSWWISKMQSGCEEERYALQLCFTLAKNATATYGMIQTAFGASCMNRASVLEWHKIFKEGRESVRDGKSKEVNTPKLIGQRVRV